MNRCRRRGRHGSPPALVVVGVDGRGRPMRANEVVSMVGIQTGLMRRHKIRQGNSPVCLLKVKEGWRVFPINGRHDEWRPSHEIHVDRRSLPFLFTKHAKTRQPVSPPLLAATNCKGRRCEPCCRTVLVDIFFL
jgi:hypothetical protein